MRVLARRRSSARRKGAGVDPMKALAGARAKRELREQKGSIMFRKILFAGIATLGLLSPLAITGATEAREVHRRCEYRVYYRECNREPWRRGGEYHNRQTAERTAHRLQHRG